MTAGGVTLKGTITGVSDDMKRQLGPNLGRDLRSGLASVWTAQNVGSTLASALTGGGGWKGAAGALGTQIGTSISDTLSGSLQRIGTTGIAGALKGAIGAALPLVGPLIGAAAGWIAGKLLNFGGPSKKEREARQTYHGFRQSAVSEWGQDAVFQERVSADVRSGQARDIAEVQAAFTRAAEAAGVNVQRGIALSKQLLEAVKREDTATQARILAEYDEWRLMAARQAAESEAAQERQTVGAVTASSVTVESLRELEAAAVEVYERIGAAAEGWADRTTAAVARVREAAESLSGVGAGAFAGGGVAAGAGGGRLVLDVRPAELSEFFSLRLEPLRRERGQL